MNAIVLVVFSLAMQLPSPAEQHQPTVVVMPLEARMGAPASVAETLSQRMVERLQESLRFSRVVTRRQLEAGVLASAQPGARPSAPPLKAPADFVVSGNVGKVGATWMLTASVVSMADARTVARSTRRVADTGDVVLANELDATVTDLLHQMTPSSAAEPGASLPSGSVASSGGRVPTP